MWKIKINREEINEIIVIEKSNRTKWDYQDTS